MLGGGGGGAEAPAAKPLFISSFSFAGERKIAIGSFLIMRQSLLDIVQSLNSPFFPPHIGAEPGRAKEESRITCMRMLRTPPFFPRNRGKTIFGSVFQIWLVAQFSE